MGASRADLERRLPSLDEVRDERARRSLLKFITRTMPEYEVNWHHKLLCSELDRLLAGDFDHLLVEAPPRHGKSEIVSRRLPAYALGRDPDLRVIATSYSADLAASLNLSVQRVIDSETYRRIFPETRLGGESVRAVSQVAPRRNSDLFEIVGRRGAYRSAGVGGGITGQGGDLLIIDDPIKNREEADSPTYRQKVWDWYTSTFYTRREKGARVLLTLTRWNLDDLAGRIEQLEQDDPSLPRWRRLRLPALAEAGRPAYDVRSEGDALWPGKYDAAALAGIKGTIGSRDWAALYQQRPSPEGGGLLRREWFKVVGVAPVGARRVRYWDLAATEATKGSDPDWTAGVLVSESRGRYTVCDVRRIRGSPATVEALVRQTAELDGVDVEVWIEQEPGSAGKNTVDHYQRTVLKGFSCRGNRPTGNKQTRANPVSAAAEAGNVDIIRGPWNLDFLAEIEVFPAGAHDDQVDGLSGAVEQLAGLGSGADKTTRGAPPGRSRYSEEG